MRFKVNARKLGMREEVQAMLSDLAPLINAAADTGNFRELGKLVDRREALTRILDHCTND